MKVLITEETAKTALSFMEAMRAKTDFPWTVNDVVIEEHNQKLDTLIASLHNAMTRANRTVSIVTWDVADLQDTFEANDIPFTEQNLEVFRLYGSDKFNDAQVGQAWDILDTVLSDMKYDNRFFLDASEDEE